MQDLVGYLLVGGLLFLLVAFLVILVRGGKGARLGQAIIEKVVENKVILAELILVMLAIFEAIACAEIGANDSEHLSYPARLGLHFGISLVGIVFGLGIPREVKEGVLATNNLVKINWLDPFSIVNGVFGFFKQWWDVVFAIFVTIAAPVGNLYIMSIGTKEADLFIAMLDGVYTANWRDVKAIAVDLESQLAGSTVLTVLHIFLVGYLSSRSLDAQIYEPTSKSSSSSSKESEPEEDGDREEEPSKDKEPKHEYDPDTSFKNMDMQRYIAIYVLGNGDRHDPKVRDAQAHFEALMDNLRDMDYDVYNEVDETLKMAFDKIIFRDKILRAKHASDEDRYSAKQDILDLNHIMKRTCAFAWKYSDPGQSDPDENLENIRKEISDL